MKRPLFTVGITYLAGTVAAILFFEEYAFLAGIFLLFAGIACSFSKKIELQSLAIVLLSLGISFGAYSYFYVREYMPAQTLDNQDADIKGVVLEKKIFEGEGTITVKADISGVPKPLKLLVTLKNADEISSGDTISFTGSLYSLEQKYGFNYNNFSKGIFLGAYPKTEIRFLDEVSFIGRILHIREFVIEAVKSAVPPDVASVAIAMTTGDKTDLTYDQALALQDAGIMHLTAVSGTHLVIVTAILGGFLDRLKITNRKKTIILSLAVVMFALFTGLSFSVCRAGVMMLILLSAPLFSREGDSLTSWGIAAIGVLVLNPYAGVSLGFLSSMLASLGIILFAKRFFLILRGKEKGEGIGKKDEILDTVLESFCISLSAISLIIPLFMISYGRISIFSAVTTFLVGYIIPVIFISTTLISICTGFKMVLLARIIGISLTVAVRLMMSAVYAISSIRFCNLYLSMPHIAVVLVMGYIFMGLLFIKKAPTSEKIMGLYAVTFVMLFSNITYTALNMNVARVAMIGESIVVTKSQRGVVIGNTKTRYEAQDIKNHLKARGVSYLDAVLVTGDTDKSLGLVYLLDEIGTENIFTFDKGRYYPYFEKVLQGKEVMSLKDADIEIFDGIKIRSVADSESVSTVLNIDGKMLLKTSDGYDIINSIRDEFVLAMFEPDEYVYNEVEGTKKSKTIFGDVEISIRY